MTSKRMKRLTSLMVAGAVGAAAIWTAPNAAQTTKDTPISLRDTFQVGNNGLCEAQIVEPEAGAGLFDRRYSIICRDAAAPIGTMWVVRGSHADKPESRFGVPGATCRRAEEAAPLEGLAGAIELVCDAADSPLRSRLIVGEIGNRTYAASGFNAYASALRLGLSSLATDRVAQGSVDIPLTQATDALAFARQQAEAISADQALLEAYRRSNQGEFAEAAEFFAASAEVLSGKGAIDARLNEGLLQSNLGNYAEAERLFGLTRAEANNDPVLSRLQRNYETIHALNQGRAQTALARVNEPLANEFGDPDALRKLTIGPAIANRLEAESQSAGGTYSVTLTPLERAQLLDGQANYLRATALRLVGRTGEATQFLRAADTAMAEVRDGRVESIIWLRAQVLGELAEVAEIESRPAEAEGFHLAGIELLQGRYPESPALQSARAQLAGFYARSGRRGDALALYRGVVEDAEGRPLPALRSLMTPYFNLLLGSEQGIASDASAAADIFAASQLLQRPGLAQTQAVLARELSVGSDEAAQLFRKTINIGRAIERLRSGIAEMEPVAEMSRETAQLLAERQAQLEQLQAEQAQVLESLAQYPRYRAVTGSAIDLDQLRGILEAGEVYVKLVTLEERSFVIYATKDDALAYEAAIAPEELEEAVDRLRESIAIAEGGQVLTFPFDIERSRKLYLSLFEPVADRLSAQRHIVFEPDGAMLRLPINLLVTDDESVERYKERLAENGDDYDFTGTKWLGRGTQISTSVAATAFRDVRAAAPSDGAKSYLGLGENTPIGEGAGASRTRAALAGGEDCVWSPNIWANPIAADELYTAAERFGAGAAVVTRDEFTDSKIRSREDLADYRILHFATHGLVTAPQPECPPRPALLTSFGGEEDSDGLLSFAEIFGLRIDADLVILSACDTAGGATVGATREAGVTSGGDFALDGLVRAFVGAGGRTILASHWPVPDDYDATKRLISGLFETDGASTAGALRTSQLELMDSAETSHPFYWAAFAVVGDGTIPVRR
ncbi:CHAT domain-containing protein [Erythrobacter litoralis]|nr:CHAT domain-containing protein [Erythrobacter litoralis]AOL22790.1 CHAT domain-containing protein [Erythrobacter litoralis]